MTTIRSIQPEDEGVWRELWAGYLEFYETSLPDAVTTNTWNRLVSDDPMWIGLVAEVNGAVVGFATVVVHDITWSDRPAGLLHDLFVEPGLRGGGVGRALIDRCIEIGRQENWSRVYWMTKEDNVTARRLYDTYAPADGFVRYRVAL